MAFAKNYIADTLALAVITETVAEKNALIPGVTVKSDLSGLVQAGTAEYYFNLAPLVADVTAGDDFNTNNVGSKKAVMPLTSGLHVDEKVPNVAVDAISADLLPDVMAKASIAISNRLGAKFVDALTQLSQPRTFASGLSIYDAIVDAMGTFAEADSINVGGVADTSYSNAVNGIQPNFIMVGNVGRSKLFKTDAFQRTINATGEIRVIGEILGLTVVYAQDLTGPDFIMGYAEGIAFPFSINTLRVVDSEQFNGVRVQAEIGYPVQAAPVGQNPGVWSFAILPIDSHALKFTELAPE
jgi:hypothetical protein